MFGDFIRGKRTFLLEDSRIVIQRDNMRMSSNHRSSRPSFVFLCNFHVRRIFSLENSEITAIGIECLEDCEMMVASIKNLTPLLETNLTLNIFLRKHISKQILEIGEFYFAFITSTGKERYQMILEKRPELMKKFPLRIISSLIGVTPTQLSRIRSKK